jgi:hypothetical protein
MFFMPSRSVKAKRELAMSSPAQYCYDVEMKRALERHDERQALVVPIILRAVSLKGTPFAKSQALPKDAKPVVTWADRGSAFVDITDGLRNAIQDLVGRPGRNQVAKAITAHAPEA